MRHNYRRTVRSLWTWLWGRYHVPQNVFLVTHTVHAMQMMLHCCDKFADDFDIRFNTNSGKSVAMCIGKRFSERCVSLQIGNRDIMYVSELKYLGVHVIAVETFCGASEIKILSHI